MTLGLSYAASAAWGPRPERPEGLAKRALTMFQRLHAVDPVFANWYTLIEQEGIRPLELELTVIEEKIAAGVMKNNNGQPDPYYGYLWGVHNLPDEKWAPRSFLASMTAGGESPYLKNCAWVGTPYGFVEPDPSIATFSIMKGALLAVVEPFEADYGDAHPNTLSKLWTQGRETPAMQIAWISYLGLRYAHLVTPPPAAIVEYRPDGGLLMAATTEIFHVENPAHMAMARDIEAAVAPFNALS